MNIKKIIQLSDIHVRTYKNHKEYRVIFSDIYLRISELLKDYDKSECRIVLTGDIFHQKITISNESLLLVAEIFKKLSEIAPVIVIAGNHDLLENNRDRVDSITPIIELLNDGNISFFKESKCYDDNNIVWCNYSVFDNNDKPNIPTKEPNKKYIGLFHAPIIGATTDIGYTFNTGTSIEKFDGCDAVLCGDIHKQQKIKSNIPIAYAGSCIQQDFGESISGHGFLIWDVDTLSYEAIDIPTAFGYYLFEINSIYDIDNNKEVLKNS